MNREIQIKKNKYMTVKFISFYLILFENKNSLLLFIETAQFAKTTWRLLINWNDFLFACKKFTFYYYMDSTVKYTYHELMLIVEFYCVRT